SDDLYKSLHPSSGDVASIIEPAPDSGCAQPPENQITFVARFYSTRAFNNRGAVVITDRVVLTNTRTGQRFNLTSGKNLESFGGYYSSLDGVLPFRLTKLSDFPAGTYKLGMEYAHQFAYEVPSAGDVDDIPSVGHTALITISDSPSGKRLS